MIYASPAAAAGAAPASSGTPWTFGTYADLIASPGLGVPIAIISFCFQLNAVTTGGGRPPTAAVHEVEFELAIGDAGAETLLAKIPWTTWPVSAAEYDQGIPSVFLSDPIAVAANTRLAVRVGDTSGNALTYSGCKVQYKETA